ncbi:RecT family recombinase [Bartonella schoenbuchensis]|uniref:Bacteriophage recombination protein n=1 Tax=Bartonella schoenbuchensis (strain DSM 13525 / NCTC 13165 / R1) TaxID=687861 RepID=E6Z093_BARSR|nr:RecT family recombinase [Bartonella schoenbuchensis]AQX31001.1 phage recombination protein Bet [Bartonella schoenbuchensis R1]CBI82531.1 Bacteriophage recombination protein [Bartonella schoenbuchensis R1]
MTSSLVATVAQKYQLSEQEFREAIFKTCISCDISNAEFLVFIYLANDYGLNPLRKEIYAIPKRGGGIIPVVGYRGWLKIIHSHPNYRKMKIKENFDKEGNLFSVTCAMYFKNDPEPFELTEYFKECKRNTEPWNQWPVRMLRHKALIQCACYAFGFSGIYDKDEAERINEAIYLSEINYTPQNDRVSDDLLAQIKKLMEQTKTEEEKVLSYAKITNFAEMSHETGQIVLRRLEAKQHLQMNEAQQALPLPKQPNTPIQQASMGV